MNDEELYNLLNETINYLKDYYLDWQDYIERFSFPRMDYYYLLINISSFYKMINVAFNRLEDLKKNEENKELKIFYVLSSIPRKINFDSNIYNNILLITNCLNYNDKLLEEYKKY